MEMARSIMKVRCIGFIVVHAPELGGLGGAQRVTDSTLLSLGRVCTDDDCEVKARAAGHARSPDLFSRSPLFNTPLRTRF